MFVEKSLAAAEADIDAMKPPLLMKVPLAALELSEKDVEPPGASEHPVPLLVKVPLPALEVPEKVVKPGPPLPQSPPGLVKAVRLPAVALLVNDIDPPLAKRYQPQSSVVLPELFVIPTPLMVKEIKSARDVMVYALAPGSNTIPLTSVRKANSRRRCLLYWRRRTSPCRSVR